MEHDEFKYWQSITNESVYRWIEDSITRMNGNGNLFYTGGEDGKFIRLSPEGKLTVGTYEGAFPHIGEAVFKITAEHQYSDNSEAFRAMCELGGEKFMEDLFSGSSFDNTSEQAPVTTNESGGDKMQYQMTLSNHQHPEYGVLTVPFPIPDEQYDEIIEMLASIEMGDPLKRDCYVDEISDDWPILKRLEKGAINIDEADYLAKRLDSFSDGETAQFQGMAAKAGISDMTDFINLTFCCQQATVITDFSDLNAVGRNHVMTLNGGTMPTEEFKSIDGRTEALKLILNENGSITPYGVVYDNGMKLEPLYDGLHFPTYLYKPSIMEVSVLPCDDPNDVRNMTILSLPLSQTQINRAMLRAGLDSRDDMCLGFESSELPNEVDIVLDFDQENLDDLNQMCQAVAQLNKDDMPKLAAAVTMAKPENSTQVKNLVEQLDLFGFIPGARSAADYGKYMIKESGHFEYDENLAEFYDFERYGQERMDREYGQFNDRGYISYHGTPSLGGLMCGNQNERMDLRRGEMGGVE